MQAQSGLRRRWSGQAGSSGGAGAGVVGLPGLGQGSRRLGPRLSLHGGLRRPLASGREEEGVRWARMRYSPSLPRRRQVRVLLLLGGPVAMVIDLFRGLQGEAEGEVGAGGADGGWRATSCARTRDGGGGRRQVGMVTGLRDREGRPNPPRASSSTAKLWSWRNWYLNTDATTKAKLLQQKS
ncbi:unnamed protein product [Miscanthus lutarioriparius]|uniref:Uncharacterized protein n=1 Tax=Miscanthus lutarioriparius TaxID=422564 RepID=A0A811S600_9POAL|nr:unnamed protein product [Miscanthus lutarioriparius]